MDTGSQQPYDAASTRRRARPGSEIVDRHSDRVYRLAYRLTGNRHDAEDLTQEVFVRVFRVLSTYTPGTFEGWLHRITTNLFLDQARRKQRIRFDALSDERADRLPQRPADARHGVRRHAPSTTTSSGRSSTPAARSSAPPSCSATSRACPTRRSPQILDAKLGTVRSRIHRGRAMLREALAHRAPVDGRTRYGGPAPLPQGSAP